MRAGNYALSSSRLGSETVLDELRQVGCLKARFPRRIVSGWMDVVTLNTSGGIAGGDRLDLAVEARAGAQATIAAQAAERFYRAQARRCPVARADPADGGNRGGAGMVATGDDPVRPLLPRPAA